MSSSTAPRLRAAAVRRHASSAMARHCDERGVMAFGSPGQTFNFGTGTSTFTSATSTAAVTPALFGLGSSVSSTETESRKLPELQVSQRSKQKDAHVFPENSFLAKIQTPWRSVEWTEEERSSLVDRLSSYTPCSRDVAQARVLLLGPVGSGKSSFISSVQSVFDGRVTNRAMVGHGSTCFTRKLQCFPLRASDTTPALELWDSMGFGDLSGPSLQHLLSVVKGHAPDGYTFRAEQALSSDTEGFIKKPGLREQMHCVAFVLDASRVFAGSYPKSIRAFMQRLRRFISDMGIHQVVLLTHIDKICYATQKNTSEVYKSAVIQDVMSKAAELVDMSPSSVVPVRNYWCELELELSSDVLLLRALELLLQYTDMFYREQQRVKTPHIKNEY